MKIIIFGSSGFVGRYLCQRLLEEKKSILCCDIVKINTIHEDIYRTFDITNIEQLRKIQIEEDDVVVNLAANQYHMKVPKKNREDFFYSVNALGIENILKVMEEKNCKKMIMLTTDMVYGKPKYLPVDTKHQKNPFGPYGRSKVAAEQICEKYRDKGVFITIFRPRMIIGPGRMGILKKLFKLISLNLPVPTIGNGKNYYQMISVFDCVSAIISAIEKGCPNCDFNLGSKNPPTTREILINLIRFANSKSFVLPTPGKIVKFFLCFLRTIGIEIMYKEQYMIADENYILDISETEKILGWTPKYSDSDMLIQAYSVWKECN